MIVLTGRICVVKNYKLKLLCLPIYLKIWYCLKVNWKIETSHILVVMAYIICYRWNS